MTTDTPSAEALADKLNIICHATGITACLNAAAMLRSLASERDALKSKLFNAECMAECTTLLRDDLIAAGVIAESTAPMFMTEAVLGHVATLQRERDALRDALSEADRIMGHDEDATEWRERSAHLWAADAATPPQQEPTA